MRLMWELFDVAIRDMTITERGRGRGRGRGG